MDGSSMWRGKTVLITGHTGFKGSWLSLWLTRLGAEVIGFSDGMPTSPAMHRLCGLEAEIRWLRSDVRDGGQVLAAMRESKPDIVFHLAAQPLVRASYADPAGTFAVNLMGTVNVLEAARRAGTARAVVLATSDKCYVNREWVHGYRESDQLGGRDPYSASKACAELAAEAYRLSYFGAGGGPAVATVRAGNVIGGGDYAPDRIVPDIVRAVSEGRAPVLRRPDAVRPWQHVLDPLAGYLRLAERLYADGGVYAEAWNFGPDSGRTLTVRELAERLCARLGAPSGPVIIADGGADAGPHEASVLKLDSSKARARLGWRPVWRPSEMLEKTAAWYESWLEGASMKDVSMRQIADYEQALRSLREGGES
ncbi:CDP-glucose 4,6-dehydratase [Paenibacillus thermoaerophilus]|uniref:CDP-glucose 4,6-dehydratase n=1 Tax=Paenibacillus thermoaerophilus TaxID=1215385 RepID=A0ABW2V7N6_9BACL|nr:CDP-glucose 4,6-dehydratase [Paenibacillus thermoaerophilus]